MSYSPYFLHSSMDMGSLLGTVSGTVLKYKRDPMSTVKDSLRILSIALGFKGDYSASRQLARKSQADFSCLLT